jgi:enoyl-CoA hydratase/carnithine racemase
MNAADAIFAGFADTFVPEADWDSVKTELIHTGDVSVIPPHTATVSTLEALQPEIDRHFCGETLTDIVKNLRSEDTEFTTSALKALGRNAPLAMACTVQIVRRLRSASSIRQALEMEYRYTYRSMAQGDFIEGIRAAIIDKDRNPKWAHLAPDSVPDIDVVTMIKPLGADKLTWGDMR